MARGLWRWGRGAVVVMAVGVGAWMVSAGVWASRVTVTSPVRGPVVEAFYATGTLLPDREYPVRAGVEGFVTEVSVDKGSVVQAGQKLAFVRDEALEMRYSQAKADLTLRTGLAAEDSSPVLAEFNANLRAAEEQFAVADREYERLAGLYKTGSASQSDFDRTSERRQSLWSLVESIKARREARKLELQRDLTVARAAMDIAQWNLDQQTLRSPIEGVVLDRPTPVGTRVRVNDDLLVVADVRPGALVMRAAVDEEDKTGVTLGQKVTMTLYAYPWKLFEGSVKRIYPKADAQRRTFEVDVAVGLADGGFSAGMTGELAFVVEAKEEAMVLPAQAVRQGEVWVVREGRLVKVGVEVGLRSVERVEIVSGLAGDERVVISPPDGLREGRRVRVTEMDPRQAAGLNRPEVEKAMRGFN
ncbi:MAG: efflux RND transporter periplasmic adaptor subunit [Phycisphaeraceae bacterium]|nr:efflux RND transporter periplasmic adaptor subunit [Phycisphaeraceae bacterium]